jgi:hypothetical protein
MTKRNLMFGVALGAVLFSLGWTMNASETWLRGVVKTGTSKVTLTNSTGNLSTTSGAFSTTLNVTGVTTLSSVVTTADATVGDDLVFADLTAGGTASTHSAQGTVGASGLISTFATQADTVGSAGDSYTLPSAVAGITHVVCNGAAANAMDVFPFTSDSINKESADTAISLAAGECMICVAFTTVKWGCVIGSAT